NLDDSQLEERWIKIGYSIKTRLLVVVYSEKNNGEQLRIISVRKVTKKEQQQYDINIKMVTI
ncbi:MAG: BrnT family toxin, partial [Bacteriovorax sp.]|nr:BrnT family toxin [Bacteriovorax sp.]